MCVLIVFGDRYSSLAISRGESGDVQVVPLWVDLEDSHVVLNGARSRDWLRNLRRDPSVTLIVISRAFFVKGGGGVSGMVLRGGRPVGELGEKCVGITMLGQTTPGVMRVREALVAAGHEPVIFHANGVGGPAMEHLIEAGALGGVIDYTLSELANSLLDGIHATGPDRLRVAGRHGVPQVVVPGCVDFFNQGPRDSVPERYRSRKSYFHNPVATLVRIEADEERTLGRIVAERLNEARGPVHVVAPTRGFSLADAEGGALWDPEADHAFLDALRASLRPGIPYEQLDAHVDDAAFADVVAERYLSLIQEPAHA